MATKTTRRNQ